MKKYLLLLLAMCMSAFALNAKTFKLLSGSTDCLRQEVKACVVFDYSKATWDKDETYEHFCGEDYAKRVALSTPAFIEGFMNKSKGMQVQASEAGAQYRIVVHVGDLDRKQHGFVWGQATIQMTGSLEIVEIATGSVVCSIDILEIEGDSDFDPNDRIYKCFVDLGENLAKFKK